MAERKTETGEFSLSELFNLHLAPIRAELEHLRSAIENSSRNSIAHSEFARLSKRVDELETISERIDDLEHHDSIGNWLLDKGVVIIVALIIGYASSQLF